MLPLRIKEDKPMKQPKTLTGLVLTASLTARATYAKPEGARKTKATQGEHLCGILGSYVDEMGDIDDNYAHQIYTGRRMIPARVVRHYAHNCTRASNESASACPINLYDDIRCYYQTDSVSYSAKKVLGERLEEILQTIPRIDQDEIMTKVNACNIAEDRVYMLFASLLYYAWRIDLAGYTYVAA